MWDNTNVWLSQTSLPLSTTNEDDSMKFSEDWATGELVDLKGELQFSGKCRTKSCNDVACNPYMTLYPTETHTLPHAHFITFFMAAKRDPAGR